MKRAHAAFTLIELLVVVAIIALLISILLPSLAQAKNQAKAVVCGSNLKQQGTGLLMYVQEEKGWFPGGHLQPPISQSLICWVPRIRQYMGGTSANLAFWCPATPAEFRWIYNPAGTYSNPQFPLKAYHYAPGETPLMGEEFFSYGYNEVGSRTQFQETPNQGLGMHTADSEDGNRVGRKETHEREVKLAAECVAIGDSLGDGEWDTWIAPNYPENYVGTRHYGGAEILFVDGHAQYYKQKRMIVFGNINRNAEGEQILKRWNIDNVSHKWW